MSVSLIIPNNVLTLPNSTDILICKNTNDIMTNKDLTSLTNLFTIREVCILSDIKSSGTNGGTFTSGSYVTRILNTISSNQNGSWCTLSSNQFTLTSGTYLIESLCPASGQVQSHQSRIQNITDATTLEYSNSAFSGTGVLTSVPGDSLSYISCYVTITSNKTYALQHRCQSTVNTTGLGNACGFGNDEVYARVKIFKLSS